jgi:hypothetical protein
MTLGELIEALESADQDYVAPLGLSNPCLYLGKALAFEPTENIAVGTMLRLAKLMIGSTHAGYKGNINRIEKNTTVYLSSNITGVLGEEISGYLLSYMVGDYREESKQPANATTNLYRTKNTLFEAMRYQYPASDELKAWLGKYYDGESCEGLEVLRQLGKTSCVYVSDGYWLLRSPDGLFWAWRPNDFEKEFEPV